MDLASVDPNGLLTTAAVTAVYQLGFFTIACGCKFDKLTDFAGGTNFALLALLTFLGYGSNPDFDPSSRQLIVTVFASVWAVRLACFLLFRILAWGEDRRFDDVTTTPQSSSKFTFDSGGLLTSVDLDRSIGPERPAEVCSLLDLPGKYASGAVSPGIFGASVDPSVSNNI